MSAIISHVTALTDALREDRERRRRSQPSEDATFLPAALEIIERPVSPTARATTWLLVSILVATIAWLVFGKIDIVASAGGRLVPVDNVKLVQPAEAGVVRSIMVRDGQRVRKGQILLELDPTFAGADAEQSRSALAASRLDAARARAVLRGLDGDALNFEAPVGIDPSLAETQELLARAELAGIEASIAGSGSDARAAYAASGEARVQAAKLAETLPLLDEQIAANEALLAKGFVSKLKVIEMRRQRLAAARDREIAIESIVRATAQAASAGSAGIRTRADARARVLAALAKAENDARLTQEELVKSERRGRLQRIVSPVEGTVTQLAVHTVGGVVEAAKPMMVIVPARGGLAVDAKVLNKDIGFIAVGDRVTIKLDAFPFTRHGTVPGSVERIGSDAVEDEVLGLVYPVRVRLDRSKNGSERSRMPLSPGMTATADIATGRRSLLSYLISPIDAARGQAARER